MKRDRIKRIKNPLKKRLPKELFHEFGKYLVIFLFMAGTIGFISGFLVADNSMLTAYNESFEKYRIEDGNFELTEQAGEELINRLEEEELTIFENFYVEESAVCDTGESTLRIFVNREHVDKVCLMEGTFPVKKDEIAIDRMYADNNALSVGDEITVSERRMIITGLVALSDYSALFSNNSDMMFDAVKFGVAVVNEEGFEGFGNRHLHYNYAWIYDKAPGNDREAKEMGDDFMEVLYSLAALQNFVPAFANQAIHFTGEDMGSDRAMMIVLLYLLIVILAFIFAVTISNTIMMEAKVIGTLRASGYTKGELLIHYMTLPLFVTLLASVAGNLLGYTFFKDVCLSMYYASYSLPSCEILWNLNAFLLTTVHPFLIMMAVNLLVLGQKLSLSPLMFLRVDLNKRKKRKAVRLPNFKFFSRFRIRIILQNRAAYFTIFIGIIFANLLLLFGLIFPKLLDNYQEEVENSMIAEYQYILKMPVETENEKAEKYAVYSLETIEGEYDSDEISVYGVMEGSDYIVLNFDENGIYISDGMAEKFGLQEGSIITLKERYSDELYAFRIIGTYYYPAALSVFMPIEDYRETFGKDENYYNGYFSDTELTDIDDIYIASTITEEDLTKLSRQLQVSMGDMMNFVYMFAVIMFLLIIYLLSKIVIEKNAGNISMVKILGFRTEEIGRLYILSTAIVVVLSVLLSLPIEYYLMRALFYYMIMTEMSGWFSYFVPSEIYVQMFLTGILSYCVVAFFQYYKIRKTPMDEALKNAE